MEFQYQLPSQFVVTVGYQGSADRKLIRLVNQNFLYPNNPAFSGVYFPTPDVNSNYNALLVSVSRRLTSGLQISMNYRYSGKYRRVILWRSGSSYESNVSAE